ncbi:MAG: glycosyltransferase family 4 protein [Bacteroidetes bacterium]|nr:glycosyltransferase family 4 protein [Bacteroidota bacterium]
MTSTKRFIFVSIDGMTDPLGQSQVLPYLVGLAKKGYSVGVVSCEKRENWKLHHFAIETIVKEAGITWDYCFYETGKPFISQLQNYLALKKIVISNITKSSGSVILHCRSYLAGLIGLLAKKKYHTGFIFDMRGFWADERVEGGIWSKSNPVSSFLYNYFKRKEKEMLAHSDAVISLTHKAKAIILDWNLNITDAKITVIPCCADLKHFSKSNIDAQKLTLFQDKFPQLKDKFVLSYVGSLGTWYMADEMLEFFKELSQKKDAHFLIVTKDSEEFIHHAAKKHDVVLDQLTVVSSSRADMPYYIALSNASLFFIKPSFSKSASSPTKMGELLSMEVPIITNAGVGDVDSIVDKTRCGVIISEFNQKEYQQAVVNLLENSNLYKANTISAATAYFSLQDGVEKYEKVYRLFI